MEENITTTVTEESGAAGTTTTEEQVKTYTVEEVNALLQSEADKRVTAALAKQKKQYEQKLSLAKLDDNERAKAEKDAEIAELREQLAQFTVEKNKSELKSVLSTRGLSAEFADIINITDDIEASQSNIDKLDKLFKAAVKAEVEKRLAGSTPKGNGGAPAEMTKEQFMKLSLAQQNKIALENPELFNKFTK